MCITRTYENEYQVASVWKSYRYSARLPLMSSRNATLASKSGPRSCVCRQRLYPSPLRCQFCRGTAALPSLLRIHCCYCFPVATPFTFGIAQEHRHRKGYTKSFSFDCTIILRRASNNALATHKANRDTSETYRFSASRSIAKHYNTLRAVHTNLIAPHIIHNGSRACPS